MAENILWTIVLPLLLQEWTQKETELNEKHEGKKKKKEFGSSNNQGLISCRW